MYIASPLVPYAAVHRCRMFCLRAPTSIWLMCMLEILEMCSSALTLVLSMPMKAPKDSSRRTWPCTSEPTLRLWHILQCSTHCLCINTLKKMLVEATSRLLHSLQCSTRLYQCAGKAVPSIQGRPKPEALAQPAEQHHVVSVWAVLG